MGRNQVGGNIKKSRFDFNNQCSKRLIRRQIKFWLLGFVWPATRSVESDLSFGIWDLNNFMLEKEELFLIILSFVNYIWDTTLGSVIPGQQMAIFWGEFYQDLITTSE